VLTLAATAAWRELKMQQSVPLPMAGSHPIGANV
jgi:hypothetical protein